MLPQKICFVDIETTGTSAYYNRIIEIGVLKTINGKVVKKLNTLVNPQTRLDPFIENLTGISQSDLSDAPLFEDIKDELYELLSDSYFAAHNVRFDYGFIKSEFKRIDMKFNQKQICTVKLSRLLYPTLKHHNLDSIISNFDIKCINRHRAYDDAKVIFDFYSKVQKQFSTEKFEKTINRILKKPSIPLSIDQEVLDSLPESPGVYKFYGHDDSLLYIGKSINIRDRVFSHFSSDLISRTDMKISREIERIQAIETAGELEALLLESRLIKQEQPLYNRRLRYARKMTILLKDMNINGYFTIKISELEKIEIENIDKIIGVFRSIKQLKDFLYQTSNEFNLCPVLLNLEKSKSHCFSYQLGKCFGACMKKEMNLKYNLRFDEAFYKHKIRPWNFDGPILLKENQNSKGGFLIDKWCLLGKIENEQDFDNISRDYLFDLDIYKILVRFILKKTNHINLVNNPLMLSQNHT